MAAVDLKSTTWCRPILCCSAIETSAGQLLTSASKAARVPAFCRDDQCAQSRPRAVVRAVRMIVYGHSLGRSWHPSATSSNPISRTGARARKPSTSRHHLCVAGETSIRNMRHETANRRRLNGALKYPERGRRPYTTAIGGHAIAQDVSARNRPADRRAAAQERLQPDGPAERR